jgi:hypothetical protein
MYFPAPFLCNAWRWASRQRQCTEKIRWVLPNIFVSRFALTSRFLNTGPTTIFVVAPKPAFSHLIVIYPFCPSSWSSPSSSKLLLSDEHICFACIVCVKHGHCLIQQNAHFRAVSFGGQSLDFCLLSSMSEPFFKWQELMNLLLDIDLGCASYPSFSWVYRACSGD